MKRGILARIKYLLAQVNQSVRLLLFLIKLTSTKSGEPILLKSYYVLKRYFSVSISTLKI